MAPAVSVVMSVFNEEAHVAEAIESILKQTFADFEFIIIDDASTDGSPALIETYAQKDSRIKVFTQPENQGLAVSLNKGLRQATGTYLARMDADDISYPERFQKQFDYLERHPELGALGTFMKEIDEKGEVVPRPVPLTKWEEIKKTLFFF